MGESNFQKGLVSTIIPVHNRSTMVIRAVESVLAQSYRPIEILVVDDGSTDNTPDVLSHLENAHSEVRVLRQANAGPGVAREHGRRYISGEFVQYLDSDDELLPDKFTDQVAALVSMPEAGVAYGKTAQLNSDDIKGELQPMRLTGEKVDSMFPAFLRSRWWQTSTPLYRRQVVEEAGPWLPLINEEDWEYDCRVASLGTKLAYVNKFVSVQHRHDDHLSSEGTFNKIKLEHRCTAREGMYQSAVRYSASSSSDHRITRADLDHFSKSAFLLARECAAQGMGNQAARMLALSIKVNKGSTIKHRLFKSLVRILGWRNSARLISILGR